MVWSHYHQAPANQNIQRDAAILEGNVAQRLDAMMMALNGDLAGLLAFFLHGHVNVLVKVAIVTTIWVALMIRIAAPRMIMAIRSIAVRRAPVVVDTCVHHFRAIRASLLEEGLKILEWMLLGFW